MEINKLPDLYNLKDKDIKNQQNLPSNSTGSIFSLLNNCIDKADTSGDGILSEEEISVFMNGEYNEVISDFEAELESEIDGSFISQLKSMIDTMLKSSNKIEEDVSSLEGINKNDFLKNSQEAKNDENASMFWQMMGMDDAEGIFNNLDTDKNGSISAEELAKIATLDNDKNSISLQDLGNFFKKKEETSSIETTKEKPIVEAKQSLHQAKSSGFSGTPTNSTFTQPKDSSKKENRTVEIIDKEIGDQETLKTTTKEKAEIALKEQEEQIAKALEQSDLSDKFKEEYNSENKRLENEIKTKDEEINKEKSLAQDYKAQAQSYSSSITDIESQISSMEGAMSNLSEDEDGSKKAEYKSKIENLKAQKQEYINAKNKAEENEKLSNEKIKKLEQDKKDLTTEKGNILNTLSEKYSNEKDKASAFKQEIAEIETAKNEIQTKLESELNKIDSKIQELKNEKVEIKQKEETQKILDENKVVADTTPIGINGDISTFTLEDWRKLGYNENFGNNLGDEARDVATRMGNAGSKGNCLGGVKRAFIAATGSSPFGNPEEGITIASKCITVMEENENFKEITGISKTDLQYLPAGAVIVWSSSTTGDSPASRFGHISISLGDGNEASDRLHAQYYGVGENGKPRVFIPV